MRASVACREIIMQCFSGYRDDSLETVKRNRDQYEIPLKILSYEELYGWTMDKIVEKVQGSIHLKITQRRVVFYLKGGEGQRRP